MLSPYTAHKTLGHYKEPAGTQITQAKRLRDLCTTNTSFLWTCPLTRQGAWTYYFACFLPSVCYPLPCSSMSKSVLESIQRKSLAIIIARCGFNRNTKREIIFGPLELGGANFRHLYHQQGLGQIKLFLTHWRSQTTQAGKLLRIALQWFQQAVGTSTSILEDVTSSLPHLESKWFKSLRDFLASINASMHLDKPGIPVIQRRHDVFLMELILQSKQYTASQIRRLNYCRLYLRATTLADVTNIAGDHVEEFALTGNIPAIHRKIRGPWIHQEKPGEAEWKLWQKASRLWCTPGGKLHQVLGRWLLPIHNQRMSHIAYRYKDKAYIRQPLGEYQVCQLVPHNGPAWISTSRHVEWDRLPAMSTPVEIQYEGQERWFQVAQSFIAPASTESIISTFEEYIPSLETWESDLLQHTELFMDPYSVSVTLSHGLRVVSDGSEKYGTQGAFGWALSDDRGERVATGMGPARGATASAFRAEAFGMLAVTRFLMRLGEFTGHFDDWNGIMATDSQSVLDTIQHCTMLPPGPGHPAEIRAYQGNWKTLHVMSANWDVLIELQESLKLLPGVSLQHVRGHQDLHTSISKLASPRATQRRCGPSSFEIPMSLWGHTTARLPHASYTGPCP